MFERDESGGRTTTVRSDRPVSTNPITTNRAPRIRKPISTIARTGEPMLTEPSGSKPNHHTIDAAPPLHPMPAPPTCTAEAVFDAREAAAETAHESGQDNERFAQRKPTKKRALIFGAGDREGTPCLVRDMSTTGVQIEMPRDQASVSRAGDFVPPRFRLQIPVERTEVDCEMAWRQGSRIGAKFTSAPRLLPAPERRKDSGRGDNRAKAGGGQLLDRLFKR